MDKQENIEFSTKRLPSLDGLRAVSICMVVIGHCRGTVPGLGPTALTILRFVGNGQLGVSMFFVISGFLITTLLVREQLATRHLNLKNFYIRRAFRIFPAFYAYWLFVLVLTMVGYIRLSHSDLITSAVYIWNYVPREIDTWFLGHTWSLSVEEQFYLFWPLILWLGNPKQTKWVAIGVIVAEPFVRVSTYFLLPFSRPLIGMMAHTRADSMMIGALLALVCLSEDQQYVLKRIAGSSLIPVGALCFFVADTVLARSLRGEYLLSIGYSMQNIVVAMLIAHVIYYEKTSLGRVLNHPTMVHLGVISYSLYIWQQLFLTAKNTTITGLFPLNLVCALLAAELSYYALEKPFLGWRRRFSRVLRPEDVKSAHETGVTTSEATRVAASAPA
jgi:peptidoglycan/LPS O-acetylase OafA/YrhL